ncbi:MAG: hypothetical protein HKN23_02830 [Verrucomicrobiales bacterium]|nr:hypothetical protein [Verrucomicrobiales bacterium]
MRRLATCSQGSCRAQSAGVQRGQVEVRNSFQDMPDGICSFVSELDSIGCMTNANGVEDN